MTSKLGGTAMKEADYTKVWRYEIAKVGNIQVV